MRARRNPQSTMLAFVNLDERVPSDHPLRIVEQVADDVLPRMSDDAETEGKAVRGPGTARMALLCGQRPLYVTPGAVLPHPVRSPPSPTRPKGIE